jgi:hypothetical protein
VRLHDEILLCRRESHSFPCSLFTSFTCVTKSEQRYVAVFDLTFPDNLLGARVGLTPL